MIRWNMTADHVRNAAAALEALRATDAEAARAGADELRIEVLRVIMNGNTDDPKALAAAALLTVERP